MVDLTHDRAALEGYRRGDRALLGRLFEVHAEQVARWATGGFTFSSGDARRRFDGFRSAVDVHDVVHEVFRMAFEERARAGYSGLTPWEAYLFGITKNVVLRRLQRARREQPVDVASMSRLVSEDESPEESAVREEEVTMVRAFLATLSADERRFAELRFSEQRAQTEVGGLLGWTRKKVRIEEEAIRRSLVRFLARRRGRAEVAG